MTEQKQEETMNTPELFKWLQASMTISRLHFLLLLGLIGILLLVLWNQQTALVSIANYVEQVSSRLIV